MGEQSEAAAVPEVALRVMQFHQLVFIVSRQIGAPHRVKRFRSRPETIQSSPSISIVEVNIFNKENLVTYAGA
jgi:hypothetical protein